jgi:release factor glutamine methyltransferase
MSWEVLLQRAAEKMRAAGIDSPRREARLLLAHALRGRPEHIVSTRLPPVSAKVLEHFEISVARRTAREPLAYIVGAREFWSLDFAVAPGVLIPRPESETLIEEALRRFPARQAPLRVLDLGTGSGCLLLAFLSERPRAFGLGVDISEIAAATARRNANSLGLADRAKFIRGDWANAIRGVFDTIFINPPYIETDELARLQPEVARYEPRTALDGGKDGLLAYRCIAAFLGAYLAPDGMAFLEAGQGQGKPIEKLIGEAKLSMDGTVCDLAGIPRCMIVRAGRQRDTSKKQLAIETRSG